MVAAKRPLTGKTITKDVDRPSSDLSESGTAVAVVLVLVLLSPLSALRLEVAVVVALCLLLTVGVFYHGSGACEKTIDGDCV